MKKTIIRLLSVLAVAVILFSLSAPVFAVDTPEENEVVATQQESAEKDSSSTKVKALAAAILVGLAASFGAVAMGLSISKGSESIARQPEASGNIRTNVMLGLVFIETAIIYALIVAILIIFVL
ncbi:MAG: ATP synthase F0 subunit C [Clostridiales bacterium]|nr:ATP synthase F0 subunit C [Clostridiales bacterium]